MQDILYIIVKVKQFTSRWFKTLLQKKLRVPTCNVMGSKGVRWAKNECKIEKRLVPFVHMMAGPVGLAPKWDGGKTISRWGEEQPHFLCRASNI
jgi:hypothetical protein